MKNKLKRLKIIIIIELVIALFLSLAIIASIQYGMEYLASNEDDINIAGKPVIYLYPQQETDAQVELNFNGKLTTTYPSYNNGGKVHAYPNGKLVSENKEYNYLYWEGESNIQWDFSKGYCVKGEDTAQFLEGALEQQGLNRKEANEFIVYWLPKMEPNPYNIISFQTTQYTDNAQLNVNPKPDTEIRVFMAWCFSDKQVDIEPQEFNTPQRNGFTLVEGGGTEVSSSNIE